MLMWNDYVPFPGQRVMVNFEGRNAGAYNRQAENNAGYIISPLQDAYYVEWNKLTESTKREVTVKVKWDNGHVNDYYIKDLLPIDAPIKEVQRLMLANGNTTTGLEEDVEKVFDDMVIKRGGTVRRLTKYDQEWRDGLLKKIPS